jgi:hypothetical protein
MNKYLFIFLLAMPILAGAQPYSYLQIDTNGVVYFLLNNHRTNAFIFMENDPGFATAVQAVQNNGGGGGTSSLTNQIVNEVWVSSSNSVADFNTGTILGNGFLSTPFYGDFDAIINSQPANTLFHLLPGTFSSRGNANNAGDPYLLAGDRLRGAGIDITTIQRNSSFYGYANTNASEVRTIYANADNVQVSDLTVDCNGSNTSSNKYEAIHYYGNRDIVRNVKAINASGNSTNGTEAFVFFLEYTNPPATYGDYIEDCIVTNVLGTYVNGIQAAGDTTVMNNHVYLPVITNVLELNNPPTQNFYVGINVAAANNPSVINNYVYGGLYSFYADTGNITNILAFGNHFINCWYGVDITCQSVDTLFIIHNTIDLNTNSLAYGRAGIQLNNVNTNYSPFVKIRIAGNNTKYWNNFTNGLQGSQYSIALYSTISTNISGVQILDNFVPAIMPTLLQGTGIWGANNTDEHGNLVTNLNSVLPISLIPSIPFSLLTSVPDFVLGTYYTNTSTVLISSAGYLAIGTNNFGGSGSSGITLTQSTNVTTGILSNGPTLVNATLVGVTPYTSTSNSVTYFYNGLTCGGTNSSSQDWFNLDTNFNYTGTGTFPAANLTGNVTTNQFAITNGTYPNMAVGSATTAAGGWPAYPTTNNLLSTNSFNAQTNTIIGAATNGAAAISASLITAATNSILVTATNAGAAITATLITPATNSILTTATNASALITGTLITPATNSILVTATNSAAATAANLTGAAVNGVYQPTNSILTQLATQNSVGQTNMPFAKGFTSTNGYFTPVANADGSTNWTYVATNTPVSTINNSGGTSGQVLTSTGSAVTWSNAPASSSSSTTVEHTINGWIANSIGVGASAVQWRGLNNEGAISSIGYGNTTITFVCPMALSTPFTLTNLLCSMGTVQMLTTTNIAFRVYVNSTFTGIMGRIKGDGAYNYHQTNDLIDSYTVTNANWQTNTYYMQVSNESGGTFSFPGCSWTLQATATH